MLQLQNCKNGYFTQRIPARSNFLPTGQYWVLPARALRQSSSLEVVARSVPEGGTSSDQFRGNCKYAKCVPGRVLHKTHKTSGSWKYWLEDHCSFQVWGKARWAAPSRGLLSRTPTPTLGWRSYRGPCVSSWQRAPQKFTGWGQETWYWHIKS